MNNPELIQACTNQTCALRNQCRRFTGPNKIGTAYYKPKKIGAHWVCNQYWYNGQTTIKIPRK